MKKITLGNVLEAVALGLTGKAFELKPEQVGGTSVRGFGKSALRTRDRRTKA